jgi:hypothetical protein
MGKPLELNLAGLSEDHAAGWGRLGYALADQHLAGAGVGGDPGGQEQTPYRLLSWSISRSYAAGPAAAVLIQRGGGVGGLMRVDADHHRHGGAFLEGKRTPGGQADLGQGQSSVEPLPVGCRQDRTTVLEPTRNEWQWRLWSDLPAPWNPTAAAPEPLPPI